MASGPTLELNTKHKIPQFAFGTFDAPTSEVVAAVKAAFDAGYRHIDCAKIYENEVEVGQAIKESMKKHNLKREDIFVTSKLWNDSHHPDNVKKACQESLKKLGLDYLDLYLIHWPTAFHFKEGVDFVYDDPNTVVYEEHKLEDTWKEMEKLVHEGLAKSVGVSNFNKRQIDNLIKHGTMVPAVNQVEVNLHCLNTKLIEYCQSKGIVVEAYAPLGSPSVMKDKAQNILELPAVVKIAEKHKVTPAQVLLRHAMQRNIVVIAKSVTPARIQKNYDIMGFKLSDEEMEELNKAGSNVRLFQINAIAQHPEYPFHDEY